MKKPYYIQSLELKEGVLSEMICHPLEGEFLKFLYDRKLTTVYEKSSSNKEGFIKREQVIFKSQQDFYLCVENKTGIPAEPKFNLTIYYKVEQDTELFMFLSQLLKQYKNATTDIRRN
jgi:hypothetical protein